MTEENTCWQTFYQQASQCHAESYLEYVLHSGSMEDYLIRVEVEYQNLVASLNYTYEQKDGVLHQLLSDITFALCDYWDLKALNHDQKFWSKCAAKACNTLGQRHEEGRHLAYLALSHVNLGEVQQAILCCKQALEIAEEISDGNIKASTLNTLGLAYQYLGDNDQSIACFNKSLACIQELDDKTATGIVLGNLAMNRFSSYDIRDGLDDEEQLLEIATKDETNDPLLLNMAFEVTSHSDLIRGKTHRAIESQEKALQIAQQIGDRRAEINSLCGLGICYWYLGETNEAIGYYQKALKVAQVINDKLSESWTLSLLGNAYSLQDANQAIHYSEQALQMMQQLDYTKGELCCLIDLGHSYIRIGNAHKAIELLRRALGIARTLSDQPNEGRVMGTLAHAYAALKQGNKAIDYYEQAITIAKETGNQHNLQAWLGNLGAIYFEMSNAQTALEYYSEALEIARRLGNRRSEGLWLANLGEAYAFTGQTELAVKCFEQAKAIATELENDSLAAFIGENLELIEHGKDEKAT
jgi:tetratricopeptide (TPR) repeat protein